MKTITPPKAKKISYTHKKFGDKRPDPYFWLRKKDSSEVLKYLNQENKYAEKVLKPIDKLKSKVFNEMKSRIPQNDDSVPYKYGPYKYYSSWKKGKDYAIFKRIKIKTKKEEVILDINNLAKKHKYCDVDGLGVSPDHNILAYSLDSKGREFYDICFKDLKTKKLLKHSIPQVTSDFCWAKDNEHVFYVYQDRKDLRPNKIYKFNIYTGKKTLVYEEKDTKFSVFVNKPLCGELIFIVSVSKNTSEYRFLPADKPHQKPVLFSKRKANHEYHLDYGDKTFYISTNKDKAYNFKIMKTNLLDFHTGNHTGNQKEFYPAKKWKPVLPHKKDTFIENYEVFKKYVVLQVRIKGNQQILILNRGTQKTHKIKFKEEIYSVRVSSSNFTYDTDSIRINYDSLTQPTSVYDYDIKTKKLKLKKQQKILGSFKSKNYIAKREFAKSRDGTKIPISIVYKKNLKVTKNTPLLLYGYGSYGMSMDPDFSSTVFSLLDRGFVYAIAHIRGGSEMGKLWYENGKFLKKKNTFYDFIDSAKHLIKKSYTSRKHLYIMGGSAGGLLMGAVLNEESKLFNGAVALVPFVDALTTILDDSLPLTTAEYEEWGNPNNKTYYKYMKSYSPYDNVKKTEYPHLFVGTGYHDPRVQYWEPAKWVAKLRDYKTDKNLLVLSTNMGTGHFGDTGRFGSLKRIAESYAFIIGLETDLLK